MNRNSYLCVFLHDHPSDWTVLLNAKGIQIKCQDDLAIFNYDMLNCDFTDPLVQEARGIILDTANLEVVCWPFRKFGNYQEPYADDIDWTTARVQDKIDGSIMKLWYGKDALWHWSSNGVIDARNAVTEQGVSFLTLIHSASNYSQIPFDQLQRDRTYIFELVSPMNQVVVRYDTPMLYHTGTRSNITGEEFIEEIGIPHPAEYPIASLRDCIAAAEALNAGMEEIEKEGFVVVDSRWHRVKVKSPEYVIGHHLVDHRRASAKEIIPMILDGSVDLAKVSEGNPYLALLFKYYDFRLSEIFYESEQTAVYARALYEEFSHSRKAVAEVIRHKKYSGAGFWALTHPGEPVTSYWRVSDLIRLIPPYESGN